MCPFLSCRLPVSCLCLSVSFLSLSLAFLSFCFPVNCLSFAFLEIVCLCVFISCLRFPDSCHFVSKPSRLLLLRLSMSCHHELFSVVESKQVRTTNYTHLFSHSVYLWLLLLAVSSSPVKSTHRTWYPGVVINDDGSGDWSGTVCVHYPDEAPECGWRMELSFSKNLLYAMVS